MIGYFISLSGFERVLLVFGILSLSVVIVNLTVEILERMDKGIRQKKSGTMSILLTMSGASIFSFFTLFMISKGVSWYMAYPVSVLVTLAYMFAAFIFLGISKKIRPLEKDNRVAIGHTGLVYRTVLPDEETGCVSVDVFGSTIESYAISATDEILPIGTVVKIIDADDDILVCISDKDSK